MQPLLHQAFELLRQYSDLKGEAERDRLELQAEVNHRNKPLALDIEAFNRLVNELSTSKDKLSPKDFEHKLMLISVFASKISSGFDDFVSEVDTLLQAGS